MGMTDTVTKEYMRGNKVFADAFNYLIYGGEQVVKPALLQELDTTEIAIPFALDEEENTTEEAVQKYRDVLGLFFRGFRTTTEGINSRERCGRVGGLPAD